MEGSEVSGQLHRSTTGFTEKIIEIIEGKVDTKKIQEIRIKVNKPVIINTANEELVLDYLVSKEELKYIITKISSYSLYAFEEEMRQGYITLEVDIELV